MTSTSRASASPPRPGQRIELTSGLSAAVRFVGTTSFALGEWIGLEFDGPEGKNDGSVAGRRYFACDPGHGMFVRAKAVARVLESYSDEATPKALVLQRHAGMGGVANDSSRAEGQLLGSQLRVSSAMSGEFVKPSTVREAGIARTAFEDDVTVGRQHVGLGDDETALSRSRGVLASRDGQTSPSPVSEADSEHTWQTLESSNASNHGSQMSTEAAVGKPDPSQLQSSIVLSNTTTTDHGHPVEPLGRVSAAVSRQPPSSTLRKSSTTKQVEELEAKLRVLERKRLEDRDKLKVLERLKGERDRFEGIIKKLQAKLQPQQQELTSLKRQLQEKHTKSNEIDVLQAEHDSALEIATLDREMAEETADVLRNELEALKSEFQELELEVEVLRDENKEMGAGVSAEEKGTDGWLQMERSNERLREALLRLRDITQAQETALKNEIYELERDLKKLQGIEGQYGEALERCKRSDEAVENMKQQVDAATAAEDMLEELTDKNLALEAQTESLRVSIEELEDLKMLNDELEQTHVDAERQLQEEIDHKDTALREHLQRLTAQDAKLVNRDLAIERFRELVSNLEDRIEMLRLDRETEASEVESLQKRYLALADLNARLQNTKSRRPNVDLELGLEKLNMALSIEEVDITRHYVNDGYETDRPSIEVYFCLKRIALKAQLLMDCLYHLVVVEAPEEPLDLLDVLTTSVPISCLTQRLVDGIVACSSDKFIMLAGLLGEAQAADRSLDAQISATKGESFEAKAALESLKQTALSLTSMTIVCVGQGIACAPEQDVAFHARLLYYDSHIATLLLATCKRKAGVDSDLYQQIDETQSISTTITLSSKKIAAIAGRIMEDNSRKRMDLSTRLERIYEEVGALIIFLRGMTEYLLELPDAAQAVSTDYSHVAASTQLIAFRSKVEVMDDKQEPLFYISRKLDAIETKVTAMHLDLDGMSSRSAAQTPSPPWVHRASQTATARSTDTATMDRISSLKKDVNLRDARLRQKDEAAEEQALKIELLESRMAAAAARAADVERLQGVVQQNNEREQQLSLELEAQAQQMHRLRRDCEHWRRLADERQQEAAEAADKAALSWTSSAPPVDAAELARLHGELESLRGAVRYLHSRSRDGGAAGSRQSARVSLAAATAWLDEPLVAPRRRDGDGVRDGTRQVLGQLLQLAAGAEVVDLAALRPQKNRLAWRPAREKTAWKVRVQAEQWEAWRAERDAVLRRSRALDV